MYSSKGSSSDPYKEGSKLITQLKFFYHLNKIETSLELFNRKKVNIKKCKKNHKIIKICTKDLHKVIHLFIKIQLLSARTILYSGREVFKDLPHDIQINFVFTT